MEQQYRSVTVKRLEDGMLHMTWQKHPSRTDTLEAFKQIRLYLRQASSPIHIVVDIRKNPVFPLAVTLNGAMQQQAHKYMGRWLVIGINPMARLIARTLNTMIVDNIEWFDTEAEAYQRLAELQQSEHHVS